MEEGSLRCDANVSIRPKGSDELGTKTELKNMNSFRFLMQGINAEIERQTGLLEAGEKVSQETLHFDPRTGRLSPLRSKEEAHDYRYFPEPDLVPLAPTEAMLEAARAALPELPAERAERYERDWGVPADTARLFAVRPELGDYFETAATAAEEGVEGPLVASWVKDELVGRLDAEADPAASNVTPQALAKLARLVQAGDVTRGAARQVLDKLVESGGDPEAVIEREGLGAMGDGDELAAHRRARHRRQPGRRRARARRQPEGDRRAGRPGHARDQGPRRRRRGQPPAARAARCLISRGSDFLSVGIPIRRAAVDAQGRPTGRRPPHRGPRRGLGPVLRSKLPTAASPTPTTPACALVGKAPDEVIGRMPESFSTRSRSSAGRRRTPRCCAPAARSTSRTAGVSART